MSGRRIESFWWEEVAGPSALVRGIAEALLECRSVALAVPADLPWRHQMRDSVRGAMESTPGLDGLYIETIDVGDEHPAATPGELVLERFALYEDRIRYRPGVETVQEYASRKGLLENRVVWVKGASPAQSSEWIDFCRQWHPRDTRQGIFVIEDRGGVGDPSGCLRTIDYADCADENSVRLFAWSAITESVGGNLSPIWRRYMVAVLTSLCKEDVEVANALAEEVDIRGGDPIDGVRRIAQSQLYDRRGEAGSQHVLALARDGRVADLQLRLWAAQVEVLFPLIEQERIEIVEGLSGDLEELMSDGRIAQFGKPVEEVSDVELGTIVHLLSKGPDGNRMLSIADKGLRDRIFLLWKCRNHLAHRETCSPQYVVGLLDATRG